MKRMRGVRYFGSILVVAVALFVYTGAAHTYEFLVSGEGDYLRWSPDDIPIDYEVSNWWLPPDAVEPVGAVYLGYKAWEDVAGASVSFNYQGTTTDVLPEGQDNVNMIAWNAEAFVAGWETYAFGVTYYGWYDAATLRFDEVDIALNIYYPWTFTTTNIFIICY